MVAYVPGATAGPQAAAPAANRQAGKAPDKGAAPAPGGNASAPPGADAGVMAYVNAQPIPMAALQDILVRGYGLPVAQQLVATELARQAAEKKGISVTEAEVQAEHELTLQQAFAQATQLERKEEMLDQLLSQRNVSRGQWMLTMRRNALLRKLAPTDIEVTDQELAQEYQRMSDRKAVTRHIETASLEEAQKVKKLAEKEDFALLAQRYSINPSRENGGLLPPIGKATNQVSPALRQAALAMKTAGEISDPVQTGTTFHILKLEGIIEPKEVKFADVKDNIAAAIRERKVRVFQSEYLQKLFQEAKIEYANPILKAQAAKAARGTDSERRMEN